jgi:hypothetical protein
MIDHVNDTQFNVSAVQVLGRKHAQFMMRLASADRLAPDLGTLHVADTGFHCMCMGHKITVQHRPVAVQNRVESLEYAFFTHWHGAELQLLCLYLQADAMVTRDPSGTQRFMDSGNVHFKQHLLAELHQMLLGSPVFAPLA